MEFLNGTSKLKRAKIGQFVVPFMILLASYVVQGAIIFPLEVIIRPDDNVNLVSLMFIPHGVKVAMVLIFGLSVLPAVFLAQLINGMIMQNILNLDVQIVLGALGGTVCFLFPLLLYNMHYRQPFFSGPIFQKTGIKNSLSLFLSFAFAASVLNSIFHATIHGFSFGLLAVMYLFGDIVGAVAIFILFILIFRPYVLRMATRGAYHE